MFTENLDGFLGTTSGLAVVALYDVAQTPVNGFFDNDFDDESGMSGSSPVFVCKATDVTVTGFGKNLIVNGVTYKIRRRELLDDGAFVRLRLEAP